MDNIPLCLRFQFMICLILLTVFGGSCKKNSQAGTAFYYWKRNFELHDGQAKLLADAGSRKLYIRFFDIKWNPRANRPYPEAIVNFNGYMPQLTITPVIFITNQTFEKLNSNDIDSLAIKCNSLVERLAQAQRLTYQAMQIDCDWTTGTKDSYFRFLKSLKARSNKSLEATIRLHQVKYQFKTGVPPVNRGILMFYNMGKLSADPAAGNSIYNPKDAAAYTGSLSGYLLPLDIALPVFSWSVQIRRGKIIQVYGKLGKRELSNTVNFGPTHQKNVFKAVNSFFKEGIYVKAGDLFKLEETDSKTLEQAAAQLAAHLNQNEKRTIIYYELGNLNLSAFKAADFKETSAHF